MKKRGFTLLELIVAMSIMAIIITAVFVVAAEGQKGFDTDIVQSNLQFNARKAIEMLSKDLTNSGIKHIDTAYRSWNRGGNNYSQRNHFFFSVASPNPVRECVNPLCYWSTRVAPGMVDDGPHLPSAFAAYHWEQFRAGAADTQSLLKYGKAFGESVLTRCPYCNNPMSIGTIHLDGVKLMSPIDINGENIYLEDTDRKADWQAIIFYAPVQLTPGTLELRRAIVYITDLMDPIIPARTEANVSGPFPPFANPLYAVGGNTLAESGSPWNQWDANNPPGKPTMYDLLDFDKDDLMEVECDSSDADLEDFQTIGNTVWYRKRDANHNFDITINMLTGVVSWNVSISQGGQTWTRTANYQRTTLAAGSYLAGIDISTAASNPYDAVINPTGVSDLNVVRVVMVMDRPTLDVGKERHVETVLQTTIYPRHSH